MSTGLGDDIADTVGRLVKLSEGQSAEMRRARGRGIPNALEFQNLIGMLFSGQCSMTAELNRLKSLLAAARTARVIPQRETMALVEVVDSAHEHGNENDHAFAGAATGKMAAAGDHSFEEDEA